MNSMRVWTLLLAAALLSACASGPGQRSTPEVARMADALYREGDFAAAAQAYLDAAEQVRGDRDYYRLRAAESMRENGNRSGASQLVEGIDPKRLDGSEAMRLELLRAELALARGDYRGAREALQRITRSPPAGYRARWLELRGRAWEREDPFFAARVYAELGTLLEGRERSDNARRIRDLLSGLRDADLVEGSNALRGDEPLRPYAARALTGRGIAVPPQLQRGPVSEPAPALAGRNGPPSIALLLPLSGNLKPAGESVRDGFLAARFDTDGGGGLSVDVMDSGSSPESAVEAYRRAVNDGHHLVVGPLSREAVAALFAEPSLPVPVLALNRSGPVPPGQTSFALLPEDEGASIAGRMQRRGFERVVVVVGGDDAAQRAVSAFRERLERAGGSVTATISIDERAIDFQPVIRSALQGAGLPTSAPVDLNVPHDPGFDALFIAVRAPAARLLVPQLKVFGLSSVPMLATSQVHAAGGDARMDRELSGVEFVDSPWLFDEIPGLPARRELARHLDSARGPAARLFAFGMDAWTLLQLRLAGDAGRVVQGATGVLSVDELGEAQREPGIAEFRNGQPRPVRDVGLVPDDGPQG
ncbi:penicillin-binding protein activator [Pseudomarimonas salicorniae]|uniref:Penicillin-binding protein activator n=1 Tax=Pseudomarimonas salicorniae TaxID=2933270 RepID=A0ABT0GJS6_9GAMM|nr:penicillin-binding protein activator [Lysobacter sp. CAU 1642]MCK7594617.1 penicillin-binding protein activator [Lysobacter sp. CAU 1642]